MRSFDLSCGFFSSVILDSDDGIRHVEAVSEEPTTQIYVIQPITSKTSAAGLLCKLLWMIFSVHGRQIFKSAYRCFLFAGRPQPVDLITWPTVPVSLPRCEIMCMLFDLYLSSFIDSLVSRLGLTFFLKRSSGTLPLRYSGVFVDNPICILVLHRQLV